MEDFKCLRRLPSEADRDNILNANSFSGDFIARETYFCLGQESDSENWSNPFTFTIESVSNDLRNGYKPSE